MESSDVMPFNPTFPRPPISALKCEVLFPGAAVASMTTQPSLGGGERTMAGMHEALSCNIILPDL